MYYLYVAESFINTRIGNKTGKRWFREELDFAKKTNNHRKPDGYQCQ